MKTPRRNLEMGFGLFLLAALSLLFIISFSYPPRPRELPMIVNGVGIILVVIHLVRVLRSPASAIKPGAPINWQAVFTALGSMMLYLILTYFIGMVLSSFVIVYGCGMAFGAKSKSRVAILSLLTVGAVYLIFVKILGLPLYRGILFGS